MPEGTETHKTGEEPITNEENKPNTPPTYTAEQQEHINKTVQERLARQEKKLQDQFQKNLDDQMSKLRDELSKPTTKKKDGEEDPEIAQAKQLIENEKAQTRLAESTARELKQKVEELEKQNKEILKRNSIGDALKDIHFFNPSEVMLLTQHMIEQDEDGRYVVRENGVVKMNSSMEPMTLQEFFKGYAQARPYLVNANFKGGAGSTESGRNGNGPTTVRSKADLKTAKEKSDYIGKFGLEVFEKLPLK